MLMKPAKQACWFCDVRLKSSYVNAGNAAVASMQDNCTFCNASILLAGQLLWCSKLLCTGKKSIQFNTTLIMFPCLRWTDLAYYSIFGITPVLTGSQKNETLVFVENDVYRLDAQPNNYHM